MLAGSRVFNDDDMQARALDMWTGMGKLRIMLIRLIWSVVGALNWAGAQMGRTEIGKIGSSANVTSIMSL